MSWSIYVTDKPVAEAREVVASDALAPQSVKDYLNAGIDGVVACRGEDALIRIAAHGHVCTGADSYEVTSATITVQSAEMAASVAATLGSSGVGAALGAEAA